MMSKMPKMLNLPTMRHISRLLMRSLLAAVFGFGLIGAAAAEPARFVSVIEDLPLMPGLSEAADSAMSFDSASGRIAEATAGGAVDAAAVQAFYGDTLPQLGWRPLGPGEYGRGDEQLRLIVETLADGAVEVHFELRPKAP